MKLKRLLSAALTGALLCGSPAALPVASAAPLSSFRDITDPVVAEQCEFLRLLGVVNGKEDGTYFDPAGTFSRAEFVKMAICALDKADEEPAQRNRTIYQDVGPTFWARGYINLASVTKLGSGDTATALVMGTGDGNFHPWNAITYGEAVTILCRMLGYGTADAATGGAWYEGYLALGDNAGLTKNLTLGGTDIIIRAQAATLFYNLYFAKPKDSEKTYLTAMGGSEVDNAVVLDTDATADDGTTGCFQTTKDTYKSERTFDAVLEGKEGKAILDKDGKLLSFQIKEGTSDRVVTIASTEATYLTTLGGDKITVEPDTTVYREGKETAWKDIYLNLTSATPATFHYGANGKLAYLFLSGASDGEVTSMVCRTAPRSGSNPFSSMAGGGSYTMFKNGLPATGADIRQYDAATWDPASRVIQVSDLKLTGVYEGASPSPTAPTSITVMGHDFPVLSSARKDLATFRVGDRLTLLLTAGNQVAGVVSEGTVKNNPVGLASVSEGNATVKLLNSTLEVKGAVSSNLYNNKLVTVSSIAKGRLSLSEVSGSNVTDSLDIAKGTLGDRDIAQNVVVYDRVADGELVKVDYNTLPTILPQDKISYALYNSIGQVTCLVLNDATGDAYEYGYFVYYREVDEHDEYEKDKDGNIMLDKDGKPMVAAHISYSPAKICIRHGDSEGKEINTEKTIFSGRHRTGEPGGIAYKADGKYADTVTVKVIEDVSRAAFDPDEMTVTVAGVTYPVSAKVQVYNKSAETWLKPGKEGMEAARAYSDNLTLYYDRSPIEGGKIRMIVIP